MRQQRTGWMGCGFGHGRLQVIVDVNLPKRRKHWSRLHGHPPHAASETDVAEVADCVESDLSASCRSRNLAAISHVFELAGHTPPTRHALVRRTAAGPTSDRHSAGPSNAAAPRRPVRQHRWNGYQAPATSDLIIRRW